MNKRIIPFLGACISWLMVATVAHAASPSAEQGAFTEGVFFVNEDWYSHNNGTINFLTKEGEWEYRIFQKTNPGRELGCTTQFGTIYGDKFYIVSKQEKDPGAERTGSRLAVCDAHTMECLKEFQYIATDETGKSIADGRSFLGVSEKKGYIGTSNGIWVFDIEKMEIGSQIAGTGNPHTSGYGQLYQAQIGTMVRVGAYVFAVHQENGILVIDAETDQLVETLAAPTFENISGEMQSLGFGSLVLSKDGNLWASMALNTTGSGATYPYVLKLNPYTFEQEYIPIPTHLGIEDIPNSWYAWTADSFCASTCENKLYWSGDNGNSWFEKRRIFCLDIDKNEFSLVFDSEEIPGDWAIYGAGFRLHPVTNEIYATMFHSFLEPTYEVMRLSTSGDLLQEYPLINNYWFTAMPVFPDRYGPEVSEAFTDLTLEKETRIYLGNKVEDPDNLAAAIVKSVVSVSDEVLLSAVVRHDSLVLTPKNQQAGIAEVCLLFNSNGKTVTKEIRVALLDPTGMSQIAASDLKVYTNPAHRTLTVEVANDTKIIVYNLSGQPMSTSIVSTGMTVFSTEGWPAGTYFVKAGDQRTKIIIQ